MKKFSYKNIQNEIFLKLKKLIVFYCNNFLKYIFIQDFEWIHRRYHFCNIYYVDLYVGYMNLYFNFCLINNTNNRRIIILPEWLNRFLQWSHWNGFSPVCKRSCSFKWCLCLNDLPQFSNEQVYGRFSFKEDPFFSVFLIYLLALPLDVVGCIGDWLIDG